MSTEVAGRSRDGVAIIGMSCRFPGAPDVDAYWANILGRVDSITDPPPEAWDPEVYFDGEFEDEDRTYCQRGGYLGSLASFAPLAHGIPPVAVGGEPDQWLALQIATDALADAGATELDEAIRTRTEIVLGKGTYLNGGNAIALQRGLVVGQTIDLIRQLHPEHSEEQLERLRGELRDVLPPLTADTVAGLIPNIIVGRIANRLDLMGAAYTVDAACASSLLAVRHAVHDLLDGECDLALAGGSQVWMPVATQNLFCRLGALSHTQRLRAFDAEADGTLLGEGIGMVVLKRLADAERDGDRIYAVVRGVGVSSDGRGVSVMAPRGEGQQVALRRAYDEAGVAPSTIGLIEAHGTGTPVGDATEVQSLTAVFGERGDALPHAAIGSVKSMISHTIPAAGVASLIKTALALHHRVLPPTLNVDQPSPRLGLERSPFYINTETRPWIHGGPQPRRAGINAFGFGGINAHAVIEEHLSPSRAGAHGQPWPDEVCILEADSAAALAARASELATTLGGAHAGTLAELAATLAGELGAITQPVRLAIVATSLDDLAGKLEEAVQKLSVPEPKRIRTRSGIYYEPEPLGRDGKVVFVFPGEGSQYPNMLADLCLRFPEARATFDRIDRLYHDHPRGHLLSDWVFPRPAFSDEERERNEARLMELDIAVESVLTANAAVHAVVSRLVPHADAIVGHSTGEHSAAIAGGVLDLEADERLGAFCHGLHDAWSQASSGDEIADATLLALGTDAEQARRIADAAGGELYLAMDNCPHQVVLVGEPEAAARAREIAAADGVMCETLPYDRAVHTPLFAPYAEQLRGVFNALPVRVTDANLWSCTSAAPLPRDEAQIRELLVEHWTSPVRFRETMEALHDDGARIFIEVGPRGNLTAFISDILRGRPLLAVAADTPSRSGVTQLHHMVGMLAAHDVALDLAPLYESRVADPADRPTVVDTADAPPPVTVPLSTTWPALRLPEDVIARWRAETATNGTTPGPAPVSAAPAPAPVALVPHNGSSPVVTRNGNTPFGARGGNPPLGAPADDHTNGAAPATALAEPAGVDSELVLSAHMQTMESFLRSSAEVVQAYLGSADAAGAPALPLLGETVSCEPGIELVTQRTTDPAQDRYLLDHTFGREVSGLDPTLAALAVMPLAMSIEMLAESAAALMPDRVVSGLRDVRAHRWVSFGEQPRTLQLTARRIDPDGDTERARVTLVALDEDPRRPPLAEATVLLDHDYAPAPAPSDLTLPDAEPSRWAPGHLYDEAMFHGPLWRGVESIDAVGAAGARARLRVLPRLGLIAGDPEPDFILDPVVLDAAGQLVGFWAAQRLDHGRFVFPLRVAALDLYGPPPPPGEALSATAAVTLVGEQLTTAEIEVAGSDGHCHMRISGWDDKRFDVPERFAALTVPRRLGALSRPWPLSLAPVGGDGAFSVHRLDSRLGADAALWKQVWASRVLGRRERELLAAQSTPEPRQLEWLGARTAAKGAVIELLSARSGIAPHPADVEILPDAQGRPIVHASAADALGVVPIVSLTHSQGHAAAAAWLVGPGAEAGIGLDAEPLRPRPEGFAAAALRDDERALLDGVAPAEMEEWVLRCWCAKEAAGKAAGRGVLPGAQTPVISGVDVGSGLIDVTVAGMQLQVRTLIDDDRVVALAIFQTTTEVP